MNTQNNILESANNTSGKKFYPSEFKDQVNYSGRFRQYQFFGEIIILSFFAGKVVLLWQINSYRY